MKGKEIKKVKELEKKIITQNNERPINPNGKNIISAVVRHPKSGKGL